GCGQFQQGYALAQLAKLVQPLQHPGNPAKKSRAARFIALARRQATKRRAQRQLRRAHSVALLMPLLQEQTPTGAKKKPGRASFSLELVNQFTQITDQLATQPQLIQRVLLTALGRQ